MLQQSITIAPRGKRARSRGRDGRNSAEHINNEPSELNRVGASELVDSVFDEWDVSFEEFREEETKRGRSKADLYTRKCDELYGIKVRFHTINGLKWKLMMKIMTENWGSRLVISLAISSANARWSC